MRDISYEFVKWLNGLLEKRQTTTVSVKRRTNFDVVLKKIDEKINRLIDLYEDGELDKETLNTRLEQRKKEKDELIHQESVIRSRASFKHWNKRYTKIV